MALQGIDVAPTMRVRCGIAATEPCFTEAAGALRKSLEAFVIDLTLTERRCHASLRDSIFSAS